MPVDPAAIQPNSTAYGDRQSLETALSTVGGGAPAGGGGTPSPTTAAAPLGNPLGSLLSGSVTPGDQGPLSSGLTHGPGPGPSGQQSAGPLDSDLGTKLKMIASQAASPALRQLAHQRLRQLYKKETSSASKQSV